MSESADSGVILFELSADSGDSDSDHPQTQKQLGHICYVYASWENFRFSAKIRNFLGLRAKSRKAFWPKAKEKIRVFSVEDRRKTGFRSCFNEL